MDVDTSRATTQLAFRVGLELLHVVAVGPREHAPVHAPQVVAWLVAPVLGEVERRNPCAARGGGR